MKTMADIRTFMAPHLQKIDALSVRERVLVLLTALVLIAAAWHTLLMQPLQQRAAQTRAELSALEQRIVAANQNLEEQILQLAGGGERQRLALARGLVTEPDILVLDEPTTLLDVRNAREVGLRLLELPQQLVLVTHDLEAVADYERVLVFDEGAVVFDGPPAAAVAAYLEVMA